jgi:hypothetical protein
MLVEEDTVPVEQGLFFGAERRPRGNTFGHATQLDAGLPENSLA